MKDHVIVFAGSVSVMVVATVIMLILWPVTSVLAASVTALFDIFFGTAWHPVPILSLTPFFVVWLIYVIALALIVLFINKGGDDLPYSPLDERGFPMVQSFSSRGGQSRWVRRRHDLEE